MSVELTNPKQQDVPVAGTGLVTGPGRVVVGDGGTLVAGPGPEAGRATRDEQPEQTGHGWVTPLPGGQKAKCGGPGTCAACAQEVVNLANEQEDRIRSGLRPARTGHGHVTPQPGGPARCSGVAGGCPTCVQEQAEFNAAQDALRHAEVEAAVTRECSLTYRQNAALLGLLAAQYPSTLSHSAIPGWEVLTVSTPDGMMCWRIAPADLDRLRHVPWADPVPYDGHTVDDKLQRLALTVDRVLGQQVAPARPDPDPVDVHQGAAAAAAAPVVNITMPAGMTAEQVAERVAELLVPQAPAPEQSDEQRLSAMCQRIGTVVGATVAQTLQREFAGMATTPEATS